MISPGYLHFGHACMCARGAATCVLTVFFITCSIFGIFQLFLDLDMSADSNKENEYRHSIVGELLNLFQPDTLFISTGKKSFSVRLSELAG
jgi:hypothetical protein